MGMGAGGNDSNITFFLNYELVFEKMSLFSSEMKRYLGFTAGDSRDSKIPKHFQKLTCHNHTPDCYTQRNNYVIFIIGSGEHAVKEKAGNEDQNGRHVE